MIGDLSEVSVNWVLISHRCESDKTKPGPPHFESSGAIAFHKGNKTNCLSYYSSMLSAGKVTCPYVSVILIQLICKIASLHAPKVLQFLHRFQNCFCFRSILFVMHQKCGNLVFSMQTLAHQPPLLHFQLCHHRHLVSNQLVQLGNICLLQFLLLPVIVIVHFRQGMFSPWLVV